MVEGLARLNAKMTRKIPQRVRYHLKQTMAQYAGKVVDSMEAFVPEGSGDLKNSIGWTWGDAPKGSLALGSISAAKDSDLTITIFAGDEVAYYARWVEFGTPKTPASPFFFVSWRLNKRRVKAALRRAVKKGLKEGMR